MTSVICKIIESIVRDHLMKYFLNNNLFTDKQFGFIKGRSTVTQLLKILDSWTSSLKNDGQIDIIYTDLENVITDQVKYLLVD